MRYELKTVAIWPVVRITFLISLVVGFILGLFVALLFAPMLAMMSSLGVQDSGLENVGFSIGAMILFLPILYALFMAVFNTIGALIATGCYNLFARWSGGLEFDLGPVGEVRESRPSDRVVYGTTAYQTPPPPPPPASPVPPPQPPTDGENPKRTLGTGYE